MSVVVDGEGCVFLFGRRRKCVVLCVGKESECAEVLRVRRNVLRGGSLALARSRGGGGWRGRVDNVKGPLAKVLHGSSAEGRPGGGGQEGPPA